jgi:antitoxin (DNA-binding transcriptional repressor) of toxin-antitoxin stability system
MKVSAQYAQEHFADILTAIDTGEELEFIDSVIQDLGPCRIRLVPVLPTRTRHRASSPNHPQNRTQEHG